MQLTIEEIKNLAETFQAVIAGIAIIVAGYWSYTLFVKKRQKYPRASVSHNITSLQIGFNRCLVRVNTAVSNKGDVLLRISKGEIRLQQVIPLPADVEQSILLGLELIGSEETEIPWPLLDRRVNDWKYNHIEIEPGETEDIQYDFIVNGSIRTVIIYSYFQSIAKQTLIRRLFRRPRDIGWSTTTLYQIPEEDNMSDENKDNRKIDKPEDIKQRGPKPVPPPVTTSKPTREEKPVPHKEKVIVEQRASKPLPPKIQSSPENISGTAAQQGKGDKKK